MKSKALWLATLSCMAFSLQSAMVKGLVKDAQTGEELMGATIYVKNQPAIGTTTGLDGTFILKNLPANQRVTLVCSYISYQPIELEVNADVEEPILFALESAALGLEEVTVIASNPGRTEAGARGIERQAMNVVNVMSAKAIELSPDITVANVIQRMSGVTVERNSSGEGQYAILRGMDKRYNYTLINGVKIPSPDNKNRFVSLDIFPSEMLDRLEVTKSLTADQEGDGIGGAVNLIMKDAPTERQLTATPLIEKYRKKGDKYPDAGQQDKEAQLRWIEQTLAQSQARWKIVIGHHPLYADTDKDDSERMDMRNALEALFDRYGVDLYCCGHIHSFQHIQPEGSKVDYLVNSSGSLARPVKAVPGTQFCSSDEGFTLINVADEQLSFHLINDRGKVIYSYRRSL